jgi:hypothetical protein
LAVTKRVFIQGYYSKLNCGKVVQKIFVCYQSVCSLEQWNRKQYAYKKCSLKLTYWISWRLFSFVYTELTWDKGKSTGTSDKEFGKNINPQYHLRKKMFPIAKLQYKRNKYRNHAACVYHVPPSKVWVICM